MKKKIYLKDIKENEELLKEIFNNNEKLKEDCYKDTYELSMEQQLEFGELCLGKDYHNYIDIRDNYSSFYLVLRNGTKLIENIDKDYLNTEEEELYNKAIKILEKMNNETMYSDKYYEYEDKLDNITKELLELIEKDLHGYENIDDEQVIENFIFQLQNNYVYEDLYYYEDDKNYNLYEDISYTKDWN